MNHGPRAIVVGGGIGGMTAAIALRQAGIDAQVYERATELREIGAGIALASNAMKVLSHLGLADQVAALGVPLASGTIKTWKGAVIAEAAEEVSEFINVCVHRADLQQVLAQALGEDALGLGHELVGFEERGGAVAARFSNGKEVEGDLLVGADGIHSVVRAALHGPQQPRYSGYTAWRAVARLDLDAAVSESWGRGRRFGIVPIGGDRVYWFATKNAPKGEAEESAGRKQELLRLYEGWHEPIEAIIEATDPEAILRHDLYDREPLRGAWGKGSVTLLGDAAHPTTPNLGQGACQAMEDALVLAHKLRGASDLAAALREYEVARIPRTAFITDLSWRIGRIAQIENPLLCRVRDVVFGAVPASVQRRQLERVLRFTPG